jgi:hypothetical protein
MFYYLLYNSSFSFIVNNRLFSTIIYGSILYILTHAILNYCKVEILEIINNYFWIIFVLDVTSLIYGFYQNMILESQNPNPTNPNSIANSSNITSNNNNMEVTFNLLKNKINTIGSYFNKNNEINIAEPVPTPRTPLRIQTQPHQIQGNVYGNDNQSSNGSQYSNELPLQTNSGSFSTPLSSLNNSTPISMLRGNNSNSGIGGINNSELDNMVTPPSRNTRVNNMPEPIIYDGDMGREESVAGSDVGSVIDLDDFEKTL